MDLANYPSRNIILIGGLGAAVLLGAGSYYSSCSCNKKHVTAEGAQTARKHETHPQGDSSNTVIQIHSGHQHKPSAGSENQAPLGESAYVKNSASDKIASPETKQSAALHSSEYAGDTAGEVFAGQGGGEIYTAEVMTPQPNLTSNSCKGLIQEISPIETHPTSKMAKVYDKSSLPSMQELLNLSPPLYASRLEYTVRSAKPKSTTTKPRFPRGTRPARGANYYR